jgi:hypothetical protein
VLSASSVVANTIEPSVAEHVFGSLVLLNDNVGVAGSESVTSISVVDVQPDWVIVMWALLKTQI